MKYKSAIIGPNVVISGYQVLGVVPFEANTGHEALEALKEIKRTTENDADDGAAKYAVVMITEDLFLDMDSDEYAKVSSGALPAVVSLPGVGGSTGYSVERLKKLMIKAVGSDLLQ
jgi:vacuolar-type H+-ATPase subunit F/Vma7